MTKPDYSVFTYPTRLHLTDEGEELLRKVGTILGNARNRDYARLVQCHRNGEKHPSKHQRRALLTEEYGISKREADNIVHANSKQYQLVTRTSHSNQKNWKREIAQLEKQMPSLFGVRKKLAVDKIAQLNKKITQSAAKSPSCCFGGSKLQRLITQKYWDDDLRQDWINKRLFLEFMGESGKTCGNDTIKLDVETGQLSLRLSGGLQKTLGLDKGTYVLGAVVVRAGRKRVENAIDNRVSTAYQFRWDCRKRVWRLHITTRVSKEELLEDNGFSQIPGRVCGIDQNAGFVSCTIVDRHGNPVARREFAHTHSREVQGVVNSIVAWLRKNRCGSVYVENLTGLSFVKRGSVSGAKALNRTVNKIPYGEFSSLLERKMEVCGGFFGRVNPRNTSKNTVWWGDGRFGGTVHQKASYLIARRGMGLSTRPRRVRRSPQGNGVCSGVSYSDNGSGLVCGFHDSGSVVASVCSET